MSSCQRQLLQLWHPGLALKPDRHQDGILPNVAGCFFDQCRQVALHQLIA
ncbi:hypothetical protein AAEJ74_13815 [Limnospira fusiformis PMC 851.14]|uniref:Uncharacterized protein n=1 Tax=Limnospira fusiformis PMC 851.14 TaxID=2219512 RepID=A0ABU9ELA6_LIMFS